MWRLDFTIAPQPLNVASSKPLALLANDSNLVLQATVVMIAYNLLDVLDQPFCASIKAPVDLASSFAQGLRRVVIRDRVFHGPILTNGLVAAIVVGGKPIWEVL
jgi:hypothetical protein